MKRLTIIILTLSIIMSIIVGCVGKPATNNYEKDCEIESVEIPDTFMATTEQIKELNDIIETSKATFEEPAQTSSETTTNAVVVVEHTAEDNQKAKEEAERKAEEERKAQEEAERIAKEEAERKAEEERRAQEEAERIAKEEAERKAEEERKAQEEASKPKGKLVSFNRIYNSKTYNEPNHITIEQLDSRLQGYATQIIGMILNSNESEVYFNDWFNSLDEFNAVMNAIRGSYYLHGTRPSYSYDGLGTPTYKVNITESRDIYYSTRVSDDLIANACNSCVYSGMTERDAVIAINNYVCNLLSYDPACRAHSIDDAFSTHLGICGTYATIVQAMCNYVGIECEYVLSNTMCHAWNRVNVDGNWYWLDACWNDGDSTPDYLLSPNLWSDHYLDN